MAWIGGGSHGKEENGWISIQLTVKIILSKHGQDLLKCKAPCLLKGWAAIGKNVTQSEVCLDRAFEFF